MKHIACGLCALRKNRHCTHTDAGLLCIRIGLAAVFIVHGWAKLTNIEGTAGFFSNLGLPMSVVYLVALVEFVGGIALLLGVATRLSGLVLAINMFFAIILVKGSGGFTGGYEFDLVLLLSSLSLFLVGPGQYALDSLWCRTHAHE